MDLGAYELGKNGPRDSMQEISAFGLTRSEKTNYMCVQYVQTTDVYQIEAFPDNIDKTENRGSICRMFT